MQDTDLKNPVLGLGFRFGLELGFRDGAGGKQKTQTKIWLRRLRVRVRVG